MRGDTHVRFGGRARETDPGQPGHRARALPNRAVERPPYRAGVPLTMETVDDRVLRHRRWDRSTSAGRSKGRPAHGAPTRSMTDPAHLIQSGRWSRRPDHLVGSRRNERAARGSAAPPRRPLIDAHPSSRAHHGCPISAPQPCCAVDHDDECRTPQSPVALRRHHRACGPCAPSTSTSTRRTWRRRLTTTPATIAQTIESTRPTGSAALA